MSQIIEMKAEFEPTSKMKIWVIERAQPKNCDLSDHALLMKLGWAKNLLWSWKVKHREAWSLWSDTEIERRKGVLKQALLDVGFRAAMNGSFRHWRELALEYGVISKEAISPRGRTSARLGRADLEDRLE